MAGGAGHLADVLLVVRLHGGAGGLLVLLEEDGPHARELGEPVGVAPVQRVVVHVDLGLAQAVEEGVLGLARQVLPGRLVGDAHVGAHGREDLRVVVGPTEDGPKDAARHGERGVIDKGLGVHDAARAQAVAVRAGTIGGVEGEVARLRVVHGVAMDGAGQRERVLEELARHGLGVVAVGQEPHAHLAVRQLGGLLHSLHDATERVLADDHAVDHDLHGVLELLLELDVLVEVAHLAVDAHAREALLAQVLEELGVLALAAQHHWRQYQGAPALACGHDLVGHLVGGLALDHAAALRAVGRAHAGKEQAQIVVDLRNGAHRGAGVAGGGLLID